MAALIRKLFRMVYSQQKLLLLCLERRKYSTAYCRTAAVLTASVVYFQALENSVMKKGRVWNTALEMRRAALKRDC